MEKVKKMTKYGVLQKIGVHDVRKMDKCWRVKGYNLRNTERKMEVWKCGEKNGDYKSAERKMGIEEGQRKS